MSQLLSSEHFWKFAGVLVTSGVTFAGLMWTVVNSLQSRKIKKEEKQDERRYQRELKLEEQKIELQKELEATKQRHVQKLIDAVKEEMTGIKAEVKALAKSFYQIEGRLESNAALAERHVSDMEKFVVKAEEKFRELDKAVSAFHKDVQQYRTQIQQINDDLVIVRDLATKIKKKGGSP